MHEPMTVQERRAYVLAAEHAVVAIGHFPECQEWTDEHWREYMDDAQDPDTIARLENAAAQLTEEMQQLDAWMSMLAGPGPGHTAPTEDHISYLEKVEQEERRLLGALMPPEPVKDAPDDEWQAWWQAVGELVNDDEDPPSYSTDA